MGSAILTALRGKVKRLTLVKAPEAPALNEAEGPMLNEHLWALILQHLDNLEDRIKASTSCRAAWNAGLVRVNIPSGVFLSSKGMSQSLCIYLSLSLATLKRLARRFHALGSMMESQEEI